MDGEKKTSKSEEFEKTEHIVLDIPDDLDKKDEAQNSSKEEKKEDSKTESKEEKKEDSKKESKEEKKEDSKKESEEEKKEDGKTESKEEKKEDSKTESKEEKKEDSKTESEEEKKEDTEKVNNKAISQSKRLADAKESDKNNTEALTDMEQATEKKKHKKAPFVVLGCVLVLLVAAYFTGFWYFSSHYYRDVAINGTNVSNMDESQAKQTLDNFYKAYILTMHTVDGDDVTINGKDIDMQITLHNEFARCFNEQKPYIWFVEYFNHHDFSIAADVEWDQEKLDAIYKDMDILNSEDIVDPEDAYIGSDGKQFVIQPEVMGNRLDEDIFKQQVAANLQKIEAKMDLVKCDCYCKPEVYSDSEQLQKQLDDLGDFVNCVITMQLDDLELEPSIDMLEDVLEKKGSTYSVSKDKVEAYVEKLASEYDTVGTKRDFTATNGKQIKIEGKYVGYQMDQEKTADALYAALEDKKAATVEAEFTKKGKTLQGENDIGDTYIEANLTEQKVYAYKDGKKIAESDCVSGNVSRGTGTCLGLYELQGKQSPATLYGEKVPKTKIVTKVDEAGNPYQEAETTMEYSYESKVTYWMPFNGGYGLHDADGWRSSYGGNIYYYSGSHGCINLPRKFAQKLYENYEIGTPVLVFFEEEPTKPDK